MFLVACRVERIRTVWMAGANNAIWHALACLVVLHCHSGCSRNIESQLKLKYSSPMVPGDLDEKFVPDPNSRAAKRLKDGELAIDLKAEYLAGHRRGWDLAIREWKWFGKFTYATREQFEEWDELPSTKNAMWFGYSDARRQIENAVDVHQGEEKGEEKGTGCVGDKPEKGSE